MSKQWVKPCERTAKCPETQQSVGKVMASLFWDARGVKLKCTFECVLSITVSTSLWLSPTFPQFSRFAKKGKINWISYLVH